MTDFDFFAEAARLARRGEPFVTATVVRVEPPTSGKPGDRAIVTLDGRLRGWVGGSCARPTVIEESRKALADGAGRLVRLSSQPEEQATRLGITDLSMTCFSGGTMEIFIEPNPPRPRLVVVGDQPVARSLAALGKAMGYHVVAIDPDAEVREADETLERVESISDHVHPLTAVVVASHGTHDEIAVEHALQSEAPYVGLVASRKRAASIAKYLAVRGIPEERLATLHSPAGLDIQARAPEEIALSILAEIVQLRRGTDTFDWGAEAEAESSRSAAESGVSEPDETAVDPVCGMTVAVSTSHRHEHRGVRYYFCCGGCLSRFLEEPETFLATETAP